MHRLPYQHQFGWSKSSPVRNSEDVMSPLLGNGPEGRNKMRKVCQSCHSSNHTDGFFAQADKAVNLYNEGYYKPALKMPTELKEKDLLKDNPWTDPFQVRYDYLWHHEGRRARMGASYGAPDYAHWHGFFELMQSLYELENIYKMRMNSGKIED